MDFNDIIRKAIGKYIPNRRVRRANGGTPAVRTLMRARYALKTGQPAWFSLMKRMRAHRDFYEGKLHEWPKDQLQNISDSYGLTYNTKTTKDQLIAQLLDCPDLYGGRSKG